MNVALTIQERQSGKGKSRTGKNGSNVLYALIIPYNRKKDSI